MPVYSVCVATYQRPAMLRALLASLDAQRLPDNVGLDVVVVDNDPPHAADVVRGYQFKNPQVAARYLEQPEKNISLARNTGVAAAEGSLLFFVDDDEVAEPDWIHTMAQALHEHDADAVFGRVAATFPPQTPSWIQSARVFNRPCGSTGSTASGTRTSNCVVRASALAGVEGPFDPSYGLTGGEDSHLFARLEAAGARLIDCYEGVVTETVSPDRAELPWMLRRARRTGAIYARQVLEVGGSRRFTRATLLGRSLVQLVVAATVAAVFWPRPERRVPWQLRAASNLGRIEGIFGRIDVGY